MTHVLGTSAAQVGPLHQQVCESVQPQTDCQGGDESVEPTQEDADWPAKYKQHNQPNDSPETAAATGHGHLQAERTTHNLHQESGFRMPLIVIHPSRALYGQQWWHHGRCLSKGQECEGMGSYVGAQRKHWSEDTSQSKAKGHSCKSNQLVDRELTTTHKNWQRALFLDLCRGQKNEGNWVLVWEHN